MNQPQASPPVARPPVVLLPGLLRPPSDWDEAKLEPWKEHLALLRSAIAIRTTEKEASDRRIIYIIDPAESSANKADNRMTIERDRCRPRRGDASSICPRRPRYASPAPIAVTT